MSNAAWQLSHLEAHSSGGSRTRLLSNLSADRGWSVFGRGRGAGPVTGTPRDVPVAESEASRPSGAAASRESLFQTGLHRVEIQNRRRPSYI